MTVQNIEMIEQLRNKVWPDLISWGFCSCSGVSYVAVTGMMWILESMLMSTLTLYVGSSITNLRSELCWRNKHVPFKGSIAVGKELLHQHRVICCLAHDITAPSQPWSIPIITRLNNFVSNVYTTKCVQKYLQNRATTVTCLHCDVTHNLSLTTGASLHIKSWRVPENEERRRARATVWPVNAERGICCYTNHWYGITNHYQHIWGCRRFTHYHNATYQYWYQDSGCISILTHATAWRMEL